MSRPLYSRPVILSRRLRRSFTLLAFAAAWLFVTMPTFGRLHQAERQTGAANGVVAVCTAVGLKYLPASVFSDGEEIPHSPSSNDECAYCPLLATLTPHVPALLFPPVPKQRTLSQSSLADPVYATPHPCGLGSRGPPTIL